MISIITATYNRAHTLPKLYKSLLENKKKYNDFEWIIIDDGSTDNTKNLIAAWQKEKKININYIYQQNSGKMTAINNGVPISKGDIIIEIDSDDYLKENALSIIEKDFKKIKKMDNLYGAIYLNEFINKEVIEEENSSLDNKIVKLFDLYFKNGFTKDCKLVFVGDIRRKYTYELEQHENFVTEARLYNKLDKNYNGALFRNEKVAICEYMCDGYSNKTKELMTKNPYGYYAYFKEIFDLNLKGMKLNKRLYLIKHYILFSCLTKKTKKETIYNTKGFINKILTTLLVIPGYIKTKKEFIRQ